MGAQEAQGSRRAQRPADTEWKRWEPSWRASDTEVRRTGVVYTRRLDLHLLEQVDPPSWWQYELVSMREDLQGHGRSPLIDWSEVMRSSKRKAS